jgi:hypothetical protein
MQRLDQIQLSECLRNLSGMQTEIITLLRTAILTEDPQVSERLEEGKWLRGYLKYDSPKGGSFTRLARKLTARCPFMR